MKLLTPVLGSYAISQKFAGNASTFYKENGLAGHPALDIIKGYDSYIVASHNAYVYSVRNKNNPDLSRYRAVYTIFEDEGQWWELVYGHCNQIYTFVGDTVVAGSLVASMGNTGDVFSQGLPVPIAKRNKPPYPGTHLHFQQRRLLLSTSDEVGKFYLESSPGKILWKDGYCFEIPDYKNGFNGCVDPEPYLYKPSLLEQLAIAKNILLNIKIPA
jgi:murein DD-endopeptidase MepM/ murein hydrolase activator NlpD